VRVISSSSSAVISNAINTTINVPKVKLYNWCELVNKITVLSNAILPFKTSKINLYSFIVVINLKLVTLCKQLYTEQTFHAIYVHTTAYITRHIKFVLKHWYTRSVRKVSDRIFLCEHLMDYNLARLHEPTLNLSAHA